MYILLKTNASKAQTKNNKVYQKNRVGKEVKISTRALKKTIIITKCTESFLNIKFLINTVVDMTLYLKKR